MFKETSEAKDIYTFLESWPLEFDSLRFCTGDHLYSLGLLFLGKVHGVGIIKVERKGEPRGRMLPRVYIVNCLVSPTFPGMFFTFHLESGSDR